MKMVASSLNPDVFLRDRVATPSEMTGGGEFVFFLPRGKSGAVRLVEGGDGHFSTSWVE
jgi:hypothetical protein